MRVGVLVLEIFLHGCGSLKEKRRVIRSIIERARSRFNVSVAEIEHQELHQRAGLAFASVASNEEPLRRLFDRLVDLAEQAAPGGVREASRDIFG